tara:strand:- start:85 stop:381 length:297 start_codon:yes stop_codon:yes gene_type:complete
LSYNFFAQKNYPPSGAPDDIELLPGRQKILEQIIKTGYTLIFVTNQLIKGTTPKSEVAMMKRVKRITNFMRKFALYGYLLLLEIIGYQLWSIINFFLI